MIITSKRQNGNSLVVPAGLHFINRRFQPTANRELYAAKSRRDDTIKSRSICLCAVPAGLGLHTSSLVRKLKHTVNKVSSLRDLETHFILVSRWGHLPFPPPLERLS
jgi:hypothetical protein